MEASLVDSEELVNLGVGEVPPEIHGWRATLYKVLASPYTVLGILGLITLDFILLIWTLASSKAEKSAAVEGLTLGILVVYILEVSARCVAEGLSRFASSPWNWLDVAVLSCSLVLEALAIKGGRFLIVLRAARGIRVLILLWRQRVALPAAARSVVSSNRRGLLVTPTSALDITYVLSHPPSPIFPPCVSRVRVSMCVE